MNLEEMSTEWKKALSLFLQFDSKNLPLFQVEGHESKLFLSYFKKGIKYLAGGVKSGFKHVEHGKYQRRLFHCKGKHTVRVQQVK